MDYQSFAFGVGVGAAAMFLILWTASLCWAAWWPGSKGSSSGLQSDSSRCTVSGNLPGDTTIAYLQGKHDGIVWTREIMKENSHKA